MKIDSLQRGLLVVFVVGIALVFGGYAREAQAQDHGKDKGQGNNQCVGQVKDHGKDKGHDQTSISNNRLFKNPGGSGATFSTQGFVDLTGEYFQPQGTNGRSCGTCHIAPEAWSITPCTLQRLFDETGGTHPVFNLLDADNPNADVSTVEARRAAYSMLLTRGDFRRGTAIPAGSEWDVIAADDPHGFANLTRIVEWRRSLPTMNFALGTAIILWNGGNSRPPFPSTPDQHAGLLFQVPGNITGAQAGPPPTQAVIDNIVNFESSLSTAQLIVQGVGRLDSDGARGGPEALSLMTKSMGRFDLFDAWANSDNPRRAQIYRGQELFNNPNLPSGQRCGGCHNSANNGTNINDNLFLDIGTASAAARTPDLPLYTFRNKTTLATVQYTDAGRGRITGLWNDLGHFKVPTLRGLAARPPYFHNGIAATLDDVVSFYEAHLGFVFTPQEQADLVAFLNAL